ncbi:MAG: hypothetical protein AAB449_01100 [Patescibacteria group bacterium]|mgnify:CR=1 FL=1
MSQQSKISRVAPHLAVFSALAALGDLKTMDSYTKSTGLIGIIPFMQLKPEHVAEVKVAIDQHVKYLQDDKLHNRDLASKLASQMVIISNDLTKQQNGVGPHVADPKTSQTGATAS